jgi:hypothetical protein
MAERQWSYPKKASSVSKLDEDGESIQNLTVELEST